jgi:hypothetical protein
LAILFAGELRLKFAQGFSETSGEAPPYTLVWFAETIGQAEALQELAVQDAEFQQVL